jgi:hypothetical protein
MLNAYGMWDHSSEGNVCTGMWDRSSEGKN